MNRVSIFLARIGLDQSLHALANDLAADCKNEVWDRLASNPVARSINEARGFVCARATLIASRSVASSIQAASLPSSMRQRLVELVTQHLVDGLAPRLYEGRHGLRRVA